MKQSLSKCPKSGLKIKIKIWKKKKKRKAHSLIDLKRNPA